MRFLKLGRALAAGALGCAAFGAPAVEAQQAAYVGEIKFGAFGVCPVGWAEANGQILPIASNEALFAVIGSVYGGDGTTTFALPNVRGVVSVPALLTPVEGTSQPLIEQQPIRTQKVKRQKIVQHGVEEPQEPAAPDATGGTPLLACIAVEGLSPDAAAAGAPPEASAAEPAPGEEQP
jgi:microcystin-dependent protein